LKPWTLRNQDLDSLRGGSDLLNFKKKNNLYDRLVVKEEGLDLKHIIFKVQSELPIWENSQDSSEDIANNIKLATEGDLRHKEVVKKKIVAYLISEHKQINYNNIDSIIKQYHVNYYSNFYSNILPENKYDRKVYDYFEKYKVNKNSSVEEKYRKLSQIIYQECYGLSVIDELADDINFVDGLWTNGINDIRIQFKGLKRRVVGLKFENENSYRQAIANAISYDAFGDIGADNPEVLCSRRNGSRVTAIFPPIYKIPYLNIRNFNENIVNKNDILNEGSHNEAIIKFNECVIKGLPNFSIIGPMGAGKSTYLRMLIGEYNENLGILVIQPTDELRLENYYKNMDIRTHIYSKENPPSELLELSFREDRDIIFQGEIRTPQEAYMDIYVKQRIAKGSGDTYHARDFNEFITTRRNLLMQTMLYKDHITAERDIADSNDLIYQLLYDSETGKRYINKIIEVEKLDKGEFKERVIFEYDISKEIWVIKNNLSDRLYKRLREEKRFNSEVEEDLRNLLSENKLLEIETC